MVSPRTFRLFALLLPLAAVGCSAFNYHADFANNSRLYADVPFRTKAPGDRAAFVAPVKDGRGATPLPTHDHGFPITYGKDEFWERPVVEMLSDVLQRQLADSRLFAGVVDQATPESVLVKPTLVAFMPGEMEGISGATSFAEVAVKVEVLGPAAADGSRPLWHEQLYRDRQVSDQSLNPTSPYRLICRALQRTVAQMLGSLDGANVARSNVPVEGIVPGAESGLPALPAAPAAEASADRR